MKDPARWLDDLRTRLAPAGLNHLGVASADAWDAAARAGTRVAEIAPRAQAIVVVASAGPAFWQAFVADCRAHPSHLLGEPHPLDAFARRAIQAATSGQDHPWHYASFDAPLPLDFRTLAVLAGLGGSSRLGLVLDARWGPWMGLRAAAFVPFDLPTGPPAPDLCVGCPAPCIPACPGDAFPAGRWSVSACAGFHQASELCARGCAAREACPVGAVHRYPDLARLYHYNRAEGRAALRRHLGIPDGDDPHGGTGPYWGSWSP